MFYREKQDRGRVLRTLERGRERETRREEREERVEGGGLGRSLLPEKMDKSASRGPSGRKNEKGGEEFLFPSLWPIRYLFSFSEGIFTQSLIKWGKNLFYPLFLNRFLQLD